MIRRLLLVAIILAGLAFFAGLLIAAQTVGVEAWHDSALPAGAFTAIGTEGDRLHPKLPAVASSGLETSGAASDFPTHATSAVVPSLRPSVKGAASWYRSPSGVAAAGPRLRSALGAGWRGASVTVCAGGRCVVTVLGDFCQCYGTRLIDLDAADFQRLAPLSQGLQEVTISW